MVLNKVSIKATSWCFLIICLQNYGIIGVTQDQTSTRPNTLLDEADDIQRQLDNEARDRANYGRPKTIWILNFPTQTPILWGYANRNKRQPRSSRNICQKCRRKTGKDVPSAKDAPSAKDTPGAKDALGAKDAPSAKDTPRAKDAPRCKDVDSCKDTTTCKEPVEEKIPCCEDPDCSCDKEATNDTKDAVSMEDDWNYSDPTKWQEKYPQCGGRSQSPVDLPLSGHQKVEGARTLRFCNYDVKPRKLTVQNDGRRVMLFGEWSKGRRPLVYGGAAHSRRYLFHCLILHWPSEHTVGGLHYPLESQALHVSADYSSFEQAVEASSSDPQAFLGIVNIYKFGAKTQTGLHEMLKMAAATNRTDKCCPLSTFVPPFKSYACYQGSLTFPPCTETVLWLVRPKALSVSREAVEEAHSLLKAYNEETKLFIRSPQPLNDRKIYYFK